MADSDTDTGVRRTKVERVIEYYGLEEMEAELVERWTGETGERQSLRDLADVFNKRILEAALENADVETFDGEISNIYRLLRDDDVSAGQRTETRSRLERQGLDISSVESNFVSHQAIHTYLTDRRNVSLTSPSDAERIEKSRDTIRKLRGRVESVAMNEIERLSASDSVDIGDISLLFSLDVVCDDCGERYDFEELLESGSCGCRDDRD